MSFIAAMYSNASESSTVTRNLRNIWFTPLKNTILALTKSPESSPRNSGRWWWTHQVRSYLNCLYYQIDCVPQEELEKESPGITIIPVILSSDKTRVVLFGTKTAYPVYMTIGNIPKDIRRKPSRRTHVLIGYLPTTQLLHVSSVVSRHRMVANLFHHCFSHILDPLRHVGRTGVEMTSGDGIARRTLPLFACFVSDYPEQVLVSAARRESVLNAMLIGINSATLTPSPHTGTCKRS